MNGARTTFMRRGYLLTALAAVVLLAASPGTASAQVAVDAPATVNEGERLTIDVMVDVTIPAGTAAGGTVVVTPSAAAPAVARPGTTTQEAGDSVGFVPAALTLNVPANTTPANLGGTPITRTLTGSISWITGVDLDAEDEHSVLSFAVTTPVTAFNGADGVALAGNDPDAENVVIDDRETQDFVWQVTTPRPSESGVINVNLTAIPTPEQLTYNVALAVDSAGYTLNNTSVVLDAANPSAASDPTFAITPPNPDGNRDSDTITLTAVRLGTTTNLATPLEIQVSDIHALPAGDKITAMAYEVDARGAKTTNEAMSVTEGGGPVHVTVTVDRGVAGYPSSEILEVALVAADSSQVGDYSVTPADVEVAAGSGLRTASADFVLQALADDDVGDETLEFNLVATGANPRNGSGESLGSFSIEVVDATDPMIWVKDGAYDAITMALGDAPLSPGDSVEIMTDDVFGLAQGYTASYGAAVEGDAVAASASGAMVTVTASKAGEAKVTISGTAKMASSSLVINQTVSNIAEVTFPVMVEDTPLEVTLEMPAGVMDGNIVEGESYDIMVMANRAITEAEGEVEVMIMRDRAASDADDSDFTVSNATIMAGEDSATAELMVTEDMEPDSGTNDNMGEQLVLYGMAGDMETNSLTFTIWDQAVPALPLIGQLVLALFLALGGARLYRRRQG